MANRYRFTWKNDANGWNYRLDFLPYDATLSDSVTTLDAGIVLEVGTMEMAFDELPIGLMDAPTLSVTLNWSLLPSAVKTYLMNKTSGNDRSVFLFWTDRGTSGGTYTLEFCGTQANEESADYEPVSAEDLAFEQYTVTYELIDCLHHIMSSRNGSIFDGSLYPAGDLTKHQLYVDYLMAIIQNSHYDVCPNAAASYFQMSSWAHCMDRMRTSLSSVFNGDYARTTNATEISDSDAVDRTNEWDTLIKTGAVFFERPQSSATVGSQLDENTAMLVTHIYASDGTVVGGLWDNSDEYGWYNATAIIDLVRDFCETFCVKATYYPEYVTDAGGDYIRYTWNIAAVGDSTDAFTSPATVLLTRASEIGTISEGSTTIQKAETRWDLNSARYNYDITEYVAIDNRSRSTRSYNFEPVVHNLPGYKPTVRRTQGLRDSGLYQTNRISFLENGYAVKAHEQTTVNLSNLSGITISSSFSEYRPSFSTSVSDDEPLADSAVDNAAFVAWLNTAQQAASPATVAEAIQTAFGSQFQTTIEVTYPLSYSSNVQPHRFGYVHSLSGGPQAVFTHLPWSRACITGMSVDWTAGTNTITYVLLKLT
jgi:hypothetical protein